MTNITFDDVIQKSATLGINIVDMKDEIAKLSNCVDQLLKGPIGDMVKELPLIGPICDTLKNSFKGFSDVISTVGAYDVVVDRLKSAGYGFDTLKTAVSSANEFCKNIGPTFLEFCSSLSLTTIATGLQTAATTVATAATKLLDLAMKNLPLIMVIAGISAIVAGLAIFINHINKTSEEQKRLNAETAELKKKNEELAKSMKESEDAYKNNTDKMALQAGTAEKLAEKVFELSEKENKSAEEKQQLALMVDELNNAMPGLNLLYDEEADLLNKSSDAVYGLIAAKKEELLQEAMAERAVELLKEQLELEYQREEVIKNFAMRKTKYCAGTTYKYRYGKQTCKEGLLAA